MSEPEVRISDDVAGAAALYVAAALREAVETKGSASLALAGGSTPLALYRRLAEPAAGVTWERVHVFWGDERLVPPDDPGSNYAAAREALLERVDLPEVNVHRVKGELPPAAAVADYAEQLRAFTQIYDPQATCPWPRFDVVLLGLGEDGHTASLFRGSPAAAIVPVAAVTADYAGRPAARVTLTPPVFNHARHVLFLATGANKAAAVAASLAAPDDPERYPAQRIRPEEGKVVWFLDEAAAGS